MLHEVSEGPGMLLETTIELQHVFLLCCHQDRAAPTCAGRSLPDWLREQTVRLVSQLGAHSRVPARDLAAPLWLGSGTSIWRNTPASHLAVFVITTTTSPKHPKCHQLSTHAPARRFKASSIRLATFGSRRRGVLSGLLRLLPNALPRRHLRPPRAANESPANRNRASSEDKDHGALFGAD